MKFKTFRAKRTDKPTEWVFGFYAEKKLMKKHYILQEEIKPYCIETVLSEIEVIPQSVGQLRHTNKHGNYYDGDVYYHAGYGMETVSDLCEMHWALAAGNGNDICHIAGNIHDTPNIIDKLDDLPDIKCTN